MDAQDSLIWRIIPEFPDYEVSSEGGVRRKTLRKTRKKYKADLRIRLSGKLIKYRVVTLMRPYADRPDIKRWAPVKVARLVCLAFHGLPPFTGAEVAHGDGNPLNDTPSNLRWATHKENMHDIDLHNRRPLGENHKRSNLTRDVVVLARRERLAGKTWQQLTDLYGGGIRSAVTRRTWKHVP